MTFDYTADSSRHPGVPRGDVTLHRWQSTILPDSLRWLWSDVPAE